MKISILRVNGVSEVISFNDVNSLNLLFRQLSEDFKSITRNQIYEIAAENMFFVAREGAGSIVGTGTLIYFRQPMGLIGRIEDIVVDSSCRRQGIGQRLVEELIRHAKRLGVRYVDLTTNPTRITANRLYPRVGFVPRTTNVFRYLC